MCTLGRMPFIVVEGVVLSSAKEHLGIVDEGLNALARTECSNIVFWSGYPASLVSYIYSGHS